VAESKLVLAESGYVDLPGAKRVNKVLCRIIPSKSLTTKADVYIDLTFELEFELKFQLTFLKA
jgi:hypothetical protein